MTLRRLLKSKIHRATITHADLHYEGSITIPPSLLKLADINEYEVVNVWNVTSGNRLETYAIAGIKGSSDICMNGAAAHLMKPGDLVIIACFTYLNSVEVSKHKPKLVFVDENNQPKSITSEIAGPQTRYKIAS